MSIIKEFTDKYKFLIFLIQINTIFLKNLLIY